MEAEPLRFCILDVHLSDQDFQKSGKDADEKGEAARAGRGGEEVVEESVLQMSKLGLPISFVSAPRRSCSNRSRRHKKSRSRDQVTPSLLSTSVAEKLPLPLDILQVSMEVHDPVRVSNDTVNHADTLASSPVSTDDGTHNGEASASSYQVNSHPTQMSMEVNVEDDSVRVSNDPRNLSIVADTLASTPVLTDDGAIDGEASASSCQVTSRPIHMNELAGHFLSELEALLLKEEPTSCKRSNMPDIVMAVSAEVTAAKASHDQVKSLQMDGSRISNGGSTIVGEEYASPKGASESKSDEGLGLKVDNLPVEVALQDSIAGDSQRSSDGCLNWSAYWDAHYGRYFFHNSETQESTWEPPVGFETYGPTTFLHGSDKQSGISTDGVADEKTVSVEDDPKLHDLHGVSCVAVACNDNVIAERVGKGGGLLTVSNDADEWLFEDALSGERIMEHEETVLSDVSCLYLAEAGGAIVDSASCPEIAMKINSLQVKVIEPLLGETLNKDLESASLENCHWSACWDEYYSRYYFFNPKTSESTWEPPKGFEAYAHNQSKILPYGVAKSEALYAKGNKQGITVEDSSVTGTLLQAVKIVSSSSRDSRSQETSTKEEREIEVMLEFEGSPCQEVCCVTSEDGIAHAEEVDKGKVAGLRNRAQRAAQYLLHHVDAVASNPTITKYWFQRFHLFSKYDCGIKLDEEGWFSVTPEAIARHQAARCRKGSVIIDAFTGVGGNAIQFALAGHHVVAVDIDPKRIEFAHHNAEIYGVADHIDFVLGDFFTVSSSMQADVVFLSPPWGGPDYLDAEAYDILTMLQPKDGTTLLNVAHSIAPNIILFLPRNVDMIQLADLPRTLSFPCSCEVERNFLNGKLKALTAYYGEFASLTDLTNQ